MTTSEVRASVSATLTPQGEPPQEEMALGMKYLRAIEAAGGIPLVVPPMRFDAVEPLLSRVGGVCLSGGPDLDPVAYGQRLHSMTGPTHSDLDEFELAFARAADARRIPILGVCRGLQVLNVARGGTLHQHLPDVAGAAIDHRQPLAGSSATHWVNIAEQSLLGEIFGCRRAKVNSFHHQAVETLGDDLVITARAGDGTVEAVEATDREFAVGVQWHAECLVGRPRQAGLFRAFVEAASRFDAAAQRFARAA